MREALKVEARALDAVALEEDRPEQVVAQSHSPGIVVVVGACGERPELARRHRLALRLAGLDEAKVELAAPRKAAPVAHADVLDGHVLAVAGVHQLANAEAIEDPEMHLFEDVIPRQAANELFQALARIDVTI